MDPLGFAGHSILSWTQQRHHTGHLCSSDTDRKGLPWKASHSAAGTQGPREDARPLFQKRDPWLGHKLVRQHPVQGLAGSGMSPLTEVIQG